MNVEEICVSVLSASLQTDLVTATATSATVF